MSVENGRADKVNRHILMVAVFFGAFAAQAADVTGNAGLVSQYVWRGISASDGKPALQGGVDAEWDSGWYAGGWGSNVDYAGQTGVELDLYGGWGGHTGDWNYSAGGTFYTFSDRVAEDFLELNLSGGWKWLTLDIAIGEYDSSDEYVFASLTGEYRNFYATLGHWDWDSDLPEGSYAELGYGNTLTINGTDLFDYNLAYIYSEDELLLPGEGNNTLVIGISKRFGLFN